MNKIIEYILVKFHPLFVMLGSVSGFLIGKYFTG